MADKFAFLTVIDRDQNRNESILIALSHHDFEVRRLEATDIGALRFVSLEAEGNCKLSLLRTRFKQIPRSGTILSLKDNVSRKMARTVQLHMVTEQDRPELLWDMIRSIRSMGCNIEALELSPFSASCQGTLPSVAIDGLFSCLSNFSDEAICSAIRKATGCQCCWVGSPMSLIQPLGLVMNKNLAYQRGGERGGMYIHGLGVSLVQIDRPDLLYESMGLLRSCGGNVDFLRASTVGDFFHTSMHCSFSMISHQLDYVMRLDSNTRNTIAAHVQASCYPRQRRVRADGLTRCLRVQAVMDPEIPAAILISSGLARCGLASSNWQRILGCFPSTTLPSVSYIMGVGPLNARKQALLLSEMDAWDKHLDWISNLEEDRADNGDSYDNATYTPFQRTIRFGPTNWKQAFVWQ